jgi:endoglycosylceramidase
MAPFYQRLRAQIRPVDNGKLLWFEPHVLFNFGAESSIPASGDANAGFSFHVYCLPGSVGIGAFNGIGCPALDDRVFSDADAYSNATGDALMLSEFGATDDLDTIRLNVKQADQHMVSWEYWHYCECLDPTTSGSGTQAIVVDPNQPPTGANVKQAKLDVLAEPYPQVVAGTPTSFGFDEATRRFSLAYSTKGPTGKNFARRLKRQKAKSKARKKAKFRQTQIFLGQDRYPGGYSVTVSGGGIASKPRAGLLRVIACPRRGKVSVTVQPGGGPNHADCRVKPRKKKRRR